MATVAHHMPRQIMLMIMFVGIDANGICLAHTKKRPVFRMLAHSVRYTRTTDMAIETHHLVGFGHHQMQIMGNHQDRAVKLRTDVINQPIKFRLPANVNTLCRLIKNKKFRAQQQGTCQHDALGFST